MEITLWILKGFLALLFTLAGLMKLAMPKAKIIAAGARSLANLGETQIKIVGLLEVLGVAGLLLPGLLNIYPNLSGIAAACLGLTMLGAIRAHQALNLPIGLNLVFLAICIAVAIMQFL